MTVETKDLRLIKTDYGHKIKAVEARVGRVEKRVEWIEKLLWVAAGAATSWLITIVLRSV